MEYTTAWPDREVGLRGCWRMDVDAISRRAVLPPPPLVPRSRRSLNPGLSGDQQHPEFLPCGVPRSEKSHPRLRRRSSPSSLPTKQNEAWCVLVRSSVYTNTRAFCVLSFCLLFLTLDHPSSLLPPATQCINTLAISFYTTHTPSISPS